MTWLSAWVSMRRWPHRAKAHSMQKLPVPGALPSDAMRCTTPYGSSESQTPSSIEA